MDEEGNDLPKLNIRGDSVFSLEEIDLKLVDHESIAKLSAIHREESLIVRKEDVFDCELDLPNFSDVFKVEGLFMVDPHTGSKLRKDVRLAVIETIDK